MNSRCLYCGEPLVEDRPDGWHRKCAQGFFHTDSVPEIPITRKSLATFVGQSVGSISAVVPGVQQKLSVHMERTDDESYRFTMVGKPHGFILKPGSTAYPQLPECEAVTMRLSQVFGLSTVPFALVRLSDSTLAYISKRIDRKWQGQTIVGNIAMEDFCQLSGRMTEDKYRSSYEKCATIIGKYSVQPGLDTTEFFMRLIFSFITGNSDMHLKNFSLIEQSWGWTLSPAYDLVNTTLLLPDDREETALTLNGKKRRLLRKDFVRFGEHIGVPSQAVHRILRQVEQLLPGMLGVVGKSHLSPALRVEYASLLQERSMRLSDSL